MKVLIDAQSLLSPRTGIGLFVQELIHYLDSSPEINKIGCYYSVFPFGGRWGASKNKIQTLAFSSKTNVYRIPFPLGVLLTLWDRFSFPQMDRMIRGYDVVHGSSHVLPARRFLPAVLTVQDTSLLDYPEWYPPSASALRTRLAKGIHEADRIIVPSHYVKDCILARYRNQPNSIDVVYNPFRGIFHPWLSFEEKKIYRQTTLGITDPYILWIGEINPRKNVGVLPKILYSLRMNGSKTLRLVMIGPPGFQVETFYKEAESHQLTIVSFQDFLAGKIGDIILTGYLTSEDQKKHLLAAAECLIFPSLDEGFGYPLLEAMASGIPVIYPKAGALPEIAGEAGLCVSSPSAVQEYVSSFLNLINNPALYMRQIEIGLKRKTFFENRDLYPFVEAYKKTILNR